MSIAEQTVDFNALADDVLTHVAQSYDPNTGLPSNFGGSISNDSPYVDAPIPESWLDGDPSLHHPRSGGGTYGLGLKYAPMFLGGAAMYGLQRLWGRGSYKPPVRITDSNSTHVDGTQERNEALLSMVDGSLYWNDEKNAVRWTGKHTGTKVRNHPQPENVEIPPLQNFTQHGRDEETPWPMLSFPQWRTYTPPLWDSHAMNPRVASIVPKRISYDPPVDPEPDPVAEILRRPDPTPVVPSIGGGGGGGGGGVTVGGGDCAWIPMVIAGTAVYAMRR